ncbi:hypothetical protein EV383_2496 [Pseudonocardia sediminis]|uniref:Uncharacterized protein n=1 Tax=Pseudonocardia sediminis TaxID=1397368 RepID=A0A4V2FQR0_PSEST|nr:hypothetical protein [Pseudonocardia sediminis]RZT85620.1 hypothetical protein EV383_2496 [Pseudonocardia sediminis]
MVNGDENTTAFGSGSAASSDDVKVDDGGALSVGGDATGNQEATDSFNDTRAETNVHNSVDDWFNTDTDTATSVETNQDDHSSTDLLSHNSVDVDLPVA